MSEAGPMPAEATAGPAAPASAAPAPAAALAPAAAPLARPTSRRRLWPLLGLAGFLLLAAGEAALYRLQRQLPDDTTPIAVLQAQVASLQQYAMRAQPAADSVTVQADLAQKFADLNAQVTALTGQAAADHASLSRLAAADADLTAISAKMALLGRLESARMALDAGQPLGEIPGATGPLAAYADIPPPTQAALLLSFPQAARAADLASVEKLRGASYWAKVRVRLASLITITDGSHVLVGPPAAGILAVAGTLLNAGDLAGAVAELGNLSPGTQAAMGGWLAQARGLLAARAALIAMAGRS